jgi:hypothetical protein
MPNFKKNLTAEEFAEIGSLAFHERWQSILAAEMRVDLATIQGWEKHGTPDGVPERLRMHLGARRDNISGALDLMLEQPFTPWERGDEILKDYEGFTEDPTMVYSGFEDNKDMVVRVIADLLHYCMHQMNVKHSFIDMDAVIQEAVAIYNSEPHSAPKVKMPERLPKDLIPYVLTEDPAVIIEFEKKFGITQDQAVDELIENTDWGQDLPNYVGNKGIASSRLEAIRRALRAGGITDAEK